MNGYRLRIEPDTNSGQIIDDKVLKRLFGTANKKKPDGMNIKDLREIKEMAEFFGIDLKGAFSKKDKEEKKEEKEKKRLYNFLEMVGILMILSLPIGMIEVYLIKAFSASFAH